MEFIERRGRTPRFFRSLFASVVLIGSLSACSGGSEEEVKTTEQKNQAPLVDAGKDRSVDENGMITLEGTANDNDGTISSYSWTQISGTTASLDDTGNSKLTFKAPEVDSDEQLIFEVTVTDNNGVTAKDTVTVLVINNKSPLISLPESQSVDENSLVSLTGTVSDPDGEISQYLWVQKSGTPVELKNTDTSTATFDAPDVSEDQQLSFELTVTDNDGAVTSDVINIVVVNNKVPVLNLPETQTFDEKSLVTLTASARDLDGDIAQYLWQQKSGTSVTLQNEDTNTLTFQAPAVSANEQLSFSLTVTDNDGESVSGTVDVAIINNQRPIANAGDDKSVIENSTVVINGAATDTDGTISTYQWLQTGGSVVDLQGSDSDTLTFQAPEVESDETLTFEFKATDNDGDSTTDVVLVEVLNNLLPSVSVSDEQTVNENTEVTLAGSASDADGEVVKYKWSQLSGTEATLLSDDSASISFLAPEVDADETLTFQLEVTDNHGGSATATTNLHVVNIPPITISGIVYDDHINGATITLTDNNGNVVIEGVTDEQGNYSLTFDRYQDEQACYLLSATGGTVAGEVYNDVMTATYCGAQVDSTNLNITPLTTFIDSLSHNADNADATEAQQIAKQQLINMGMITADQEWNRLDSTTINYGMLSFDVKSLGGVANWVSDMTTDISDTQLSSSRVRDIFKLAHAGIEKVTVPESNLFAGQSRNITPTSDVTEQATDAAITYTLLNAPEWVSLTDESILIAPSVDIVPGTYTYEIAASANPDTQSRRDSFSVEVLNSVVLLEGTLDGNGGDIRNQFQDIVLTAPAGVLTQSYNIIYRASINQKGALITNLESVPEMPLTELARLNLVKPNADVLIQNYLQRANNSSIDRGDSEESLEPLQNAELCSQSRFARNSNVSRSNFSFAYELDCANASFWGTNSLVFKKGGDTFIYKNLLSENIFIKKAFALKGVSVTIETSKVPVLFVHGFEPSGELGGFRKNEVERADIFPRLVKEYRTESGSEFAPYLFQWRGNMPFEVAAHYLGRSIRKLSEETNKKVHIVAHSYGGIVARALIQGIAHDNAEASIDETTFTREHAEQFIGSLTTYGTPHSGVFPTEEAITFNDKLYLFPKGIAPVRGQVTRECEAITCHQMGVNTQKILDLRGRFCGDLDTCPTYENGKDVFFGIHEQKGYIAHELRRRLDLDGGWPSIKTQVLMGLYGDHDDIFVEENVGYIDGDGLIGIAGQRFDAVHDTGYNVLGDLLSIDADTEEESRFQGSQYIEERFLGFQEFNQSFLNNPSGFRDYTNYLLDELRENGNKVYLYSPLDDFMTVMRTTHGYHHSYRGYKAASIGSDSPTQVYLEECYLKNPDNCRHNAWQYFISFLEQLNLEAEVVSEPMITLSGKVGNLDDVGGTITIVYSINNTISGMFVLGEESEGVFEHEVTFVANGEYELSIIPPEQSGFRAKTLKLHTEATLEASLLSIGQTILLDKVYQDATINLEVVDALTGNDISDYQLTITNILDDIEFTDEDDSAPGIQLAPGDYKFTVSSGDYIVKEKQCSAFGEEPRLCRIELVRPVGEEDAGKLTAILSWHVDPSDLDTHLVKYDASGNELYHIYYRNQTDRSTGDNLDRDDTSSYGPETLTIQNVDADSVYVYYVHHFSGSGSITSTSLAQVDVTNFFSATEPFQAAYQAPTSGDGIYWKVFEVRNGVVEPCRVNCIMDSEPNNQTTLSSPSNVDSSKEGITQSVPEFIYRTVKFN